jgi:hypothetical protein
LVFSVVLLTAVTFVTLGCEQDKGPQNAGIDEPLMLDDGDDEDDLFEAQGPVADNSRCHVCHINFADEALAVIHARANISCEQCHGASDDHCSDEDNITPPQIMYPAAKVNPSCVTCHPKESIDTEPHEPLLSGNPGENKYCTDCHGQHRVGYRTRRWDKQTGELIEDDKVRMMTEDMLEQK